MSVTQHSLAQQAEPTPTPPHQLPLPPNVHWWDMLKCAWVMARTKSVDNVFRMLYARYGPVVRIQMRAPKAIINLLERIAGVDAQAYVLMIGPEANRLMMSAPPEQVQRAPTVPSRFPIGDHEVERQFSIASIDGETQKLHHQLAMQPFRPKHMAGYIPMMRSALERRIARWGAQIDLYDEMNALAFETLAWTMLGIDPDSPRYTELVACYWPLFSKDRAQGRMWQAKRAMWSLLDQIIIERRQEPGDDAASVLISACDQASGAPVTQEMLRNYIYMLIEFGHSDIAIYHTYALGILVARADLRERLLTEHAHYTDSAALDPERGLPFTLSLLREVERFYSPVTSLMRYAADDLAFESYRIPRGSWLMNSMRLTHHMPALFANPDVFDPDRFAPPRQEHKTPFALMGFGAGYHTCIANAYTRIHGCVVLHELLSRFAFQFVDLQGLPPIDYRGAMQVPERPIKLRVASRAGPDL